MTAVLAVVLTLLIIFILSGDSIVLTCDTALQVYDPRGFGPSLSACPKLQHFTSYKLWGLGLRGCSTHHLILPSCASLSLERADDLNRIEIEAPKLERLDLQVLEAHPVSAAQAAAPQKLTSTP